MRIVIDLQGAQADNRNRGIGRYSLALARALVSTRGRHEVFLALNTMLPESLEMLRATFRTMLPPENIRTFGAVSPVSFVRSGADGWRKAAAEGMRLAFLEELAPDAVIVTSLYEGFADNAVVSVSPACDFKTAVVLYDLIPHIMPDRYLTDPARALWYRDKYNQMRRADLLLAISESSRQEGLHHLGVEPERVVSIGTAADAQFVRRNIEPEVAEALRRRYGLVRPFVMYTGGIEYRKNIEGLIRAYALLPETVQRGHQLAVVCHASAVARNNLLGLARRQGLAPDAVVVTGYVPEDDLVALYNLARAFVFPSLHEGFGLPVLEAMHCGLAALAARTTSLPEVVGRADALFDPRDDTDIAVHLQRVLTDGCFRRELAAYGLERAATFTWNGCAKAAWMGLERLLAANNGSARDKPVRRQKMAYIGPVDAAGRGLTEDARVLLAGLPEWYDLDILPPGLPGPENRCDPAVLQKYDRVVYHLDGGMDLLHVAKELADVPGVVILRNVASAILQPAPGHDGGRDHDVLQGLYAAHGYGALAAYGATSDRETVLREYPCSPALLEGALGVLVHSQRDRALAGHGLPGLALRSWQIVPRPGPLEGGLSAYVRAIERAYAKAELGLAGQLRTLAARPEIAADATMRRRFAQKLAANHPGQARQILIDVSGQTPVQALQDGPVPVTGLALTLLRHPPPGWRIEPVQATTVSPGYRYARAWALEGLGLPGGVLADDPVEVRPGDIFLGLAWQPLVVAAQAPWLRRYRHMGLDVRFVVHAVPSGDNAAADGVLGGWLATIAAFDGALCLSRPMARDLGAWLSRHAPGRLGAFALGWFSVENQPDENAFAARSGSSGNDFFRFGYEDCSLIQSSRALLAEVLGQRR